MRQVDLGCLMSRPNKDDISLVSIGHCISGNVSQTMLCHHIQNPQSPPPHRVLKHILKWLYEQVNLTIISEKVAIKTILPWPMILARVFSIILFSLYFLVLHCASARAWQRGNGQCKGRKEWSRRLSTWRWWQFILHSRPLSPGPSPFINC